MPARIAACACSTDARIARAVRDLAHQQPLVRRQALGHAGVDHRQVHALDRGEHRHRQLAAQRLPHALGRAVAGRRGDALDGQAVVAGEQHQLRIAEARLERVLDQPDPHRQRLELAQAAGGLATALQLVAQRALEQRVGGGRDQRGGGGVHGRRGV
jgi:hypothetical protein